MVEVLVRLEERDLPKLESCLAENGFNDHSIVDEEIDEEPTDAERQEILRRKASNTEADYSDWEEASERIFGKYLSKR